MVNINIINHQIDYLLLVLHHLFNISSMVTTQYYISACVWMNIFFVLSVLFWHTVRLFSLSRVKTLFQPNLNRFFLFLSSMSLLRKRNIFISNPFMLPGIFSMSGHG